MDLDATILTHEMIVHSQIASIEKLLQREITYKLTLNVHGVPSSIQFPLKRFELELIKDQLGYKLLVQDKTNR
jgi:hypothetical protein